MRTVHLLRHAKSSWGDPGLADRERPLAPRGRRDAARMGEHLAGLAVAPHVVLCSSAVRTRQTLKLIGPGLGGAAVEFVDGLYSAGPDDVLGLLRDLPDETGSALVIGHNPTLHELTMQLAGDAPAKFPTCALATLQFDGDWPDLAPGGCELTAFVAPKQLS
jgi:phosphohistidine phosphatase